jgi:small subunit ribosomal protein S30e
MLAMYLSFSYRQSLIFPPSSLHPDKFTMGKVHGSLARAGKVKGQTPKVAKDETKKKQITGRAKKRMQYNRRFINVIAGPGGKRVGPNSNADKMK